MSSYTPDNMTPGEVIAAVVKRPALYGLVKLPTREQIAMTVAQFFGPNDTPEDVADAVLALLKGEENE